MVCGVQIGRDTRQLAEAPAHLPVSDVLEAADDALWDEPKVPLARQAKRIVRWASKDLQHTATIQINSRIYAPTHSVVEDDGAIQLVLHGLEGAMQLASVGFSRSYKLVQERLIRPMLLELMLADLHLWLLLEV
jgi:hypothetical protein